MDVIDLNYLEELYDDYDGMQPSVRIEARTFRPRWTHYFFDSCSDHEFVHNFRFTKIEVIHLTELLEAELASSARGGCRAGHVPTFLKSFRSVLERGPSTESFHSRSWWDRSWSFHSFSGNNDRSTVNAPSPRWLSSYTTGHCDC